MTARHRAPRPLPRVRHLAATGALGLALTVTALTLGACDDGPARPPAVEPLPSPVPDRLSLPPVRVCVGEAGASRCTERDPIDIVHGDDAVVRALEERP